MTTPEIANLSEPAKEKIEETTTQLVTSPEELGIKVDSSMGIVTTPTKLHELFSMITLPIEKKTFEFPKFVLNFDDNSVWWSQKMQATKVLNFGVVSKEKYYEKVWGKGKAGFSAKKLFTHLELLRGHREVIFWIDVEKGVYGLQSANVDIFVGMLESIESIETSLETISNINSETGELSKVDEKPFPFRIGLDVSELKTVTDRGEIFSKNFPLEISKNGMVFVFSDMSNPGTTGANRKMLVPKPGTLRIPEDDTVVVPVLNPRLSSVSKNMRGTIDMFFTEKEKEPMYFRKLDVNEHGGKLGVYIVMQTSVIRK